jgi:hypothetical protein
MEGRSVPRERDPDRRTLQQMGHPPAAPENSTTILKPRPTPGQGGRIRDATM